MNPVLELIGASILLVLSISALFCKTYEQGRSKKGRYTRKLTRYGWFSLLASIVVFLCVAGSQYLTSFQKGRAADAEMQVSCTRFLNAIVFTFYELSFINELDIRKTDEQARKDSEKQQSEIILLGNVLWQDGDMEPLIKAGIPKRLMETNLQVPYGHQTLQQLLESHCKSFAADLTELIGRYQSVLSSGQVTELINLRESTFLRYVISSAEIDDTRRKYLLKDYYITQDDLDTFLREIDTVRHGRFTPF